MTSSIDQINPNDLVLVGICSDENSSFLKGCAGAPDRIRQTFYSDSTNPSSELQAELNCSRVKDIGNRDIAPTTEAFMGISEIIAGILKRGGIPLSLGGDHAITYPILQAIAAHHGAVNILHFDAHSDLYDELDGNPLSHGCPFARIMENGLCKRLVQVGIRTLNPHQREQVERFSVEVHEMREFDARSFQTDFDAPLYLSFDLDALDPACAPGVSHYEPGGLSMREVLWIIHQIKQPIIGADVVEYNPVRDINDLTATVAAKLVKEIGGLILNQTQGRQGT
ncbi:MAG: agmatinase [Spirulina sp.]